MLQQHFTQKQHLKILPQQIQLLNLFHLNTLELEQRIQQEIEENPMLEEVSTEDDISSEKYNRDSLHDFKDYEEYAYDDFPDYKMEYENYFNAEKIPERAMPETTDFRQVLKEQFEFLNCSEDDKMLAHHLIDSLSEEGLLEQDLQDISSDISFRCKKWIETEDLLKVLGKIQDLEPAGIGARSIRECLLLQLKRMNCKRPDVKMAVRLLEVHFAELSSRNMDKIMHLLNIDEEEIKIVLKLIASLKMKPITIAIGVTANLNIIPDFIVTNEDDCLEVSLYRQRSNNLHINKSWMDRVKSTESNVHADKATRQYVRNKMNSAQWFISAIQQRESTMLNVMKAIVKLQYDYFLEGDIKLIKPMILKNVADIVGVDISTVSRITSNKYVATPFGTLLLKDVFTEGISNNQGQVISNRVIQTTIEEVIETEDKQKPYTDQQLVAILSDRGFSIARRTVAKYREILQIPVAQMRTLWA
ncbi:MAG TPA: RNA polymerase factor sigma-54 [Chitinophagaceae bacterium]|nr:RNA polymerase factor sigma-54 [Chitinophagaceae bacterium]